MMTQHAVDQTLCNSRLVFLYDDIDKKTSLSVTKKLLSFSGSDKDVTLCIQSPGGCIDSMFSMIGLIDTLPYKVNTICCGQAYSAAAILLLSGTGRRMILPHSTVMMHACMLDAAISGNFTPEEKVAGQELIKYFQKALNRLILKRTKMTKATITEIMKGEYYFTPKETIEHGIVDSILTASELKRIMNAECGSDK
jgi:ATP-dependent Clp protease protease subunit